MAEKAMRSGLPRIRLHDLRHTASSLLAAQGVAPIIRAGWCGHRQETQVATYTHGRPEDLRVAGDVLAGIFDVT